MYNIKYKIIFHTWEIHIIKNTLTELSYCFLMVQLATSGILRSPTTRVGKDTSRRRHNGMSGICPQTSFCMERLQEPLNYLSHFTKTMRTLRNSPFQEPLTLKTTSGPKHAVGVESEE